MSQLHVLMLPSWYPTPSAPAAGVFFREQAQALHRAGVRIGVVYPDLRRVRTLSQGNWSSNRFQSTRADEDGITTLRYQGWSPPKVPRWSSALWVREACALAERYVAQHGRPQLVHAQGSCWAGVAALATSQRLGLPYALTEHSSAYLYGAVRGWRRDRALAAFRHATKIMAVSPALAAAMQPFVDDRPIEVVPNFIDTEFFVRPSRRPPMPPFRFSTVAGLSAKKGIDIVIRAFAEAFRDRPDVVLEIGGDGPERARLGRQARELAVGERVTFLGLLSRQQVREAMWRAHGYVLASAKETFGVALLEAMATGLPVIATRSGGPDGLVTPEVGRLVPPAQPKALAEAMAACRAEGMRSAAQEATSHGYVAEQFGPDRFASRVERIYRDVIAASARSAAEARPESRATA